MHSRMRFYLVLNLAVEFWFVAALAELQKYAEIDKETIWPPSENGSSSNNDQLNPEQDGHSHASFLETQVLTLTENVKNLEAKLEEARATLQAKEAQVSELEATLCLSKMPKEEPGNGEVESELEGLFRLKIEAEIEYLAIARTIQKHRVEEQRGLAGVQSRMTSELGEVESEAVVLEKQEGHKADSLVSADIGGVDEVLRFQSRTCKVSYYLILQSILLLVVCCLFVSRLSPESAFSVPT